MSRLKVFNGACLCLLISALMVIPAIAADYPCKGKLTGDNVRIRAGASTKHTPITQVSSGDILTVYGKTGEWYKVSIPEKALVWIFAKYVTVSGSTGTVTGDKVNVRAKAENGEVVGQVAKGDVLTVIASKDGWLQIRPHPNLRAYIHGNYVQLIDTPDVPEDDGAAPVPPIRVEPPVTNKPIDTSESTDEEMEDLDITKSYEYSINEEMAQLRRELNSASQAGDYDRVREIADKLEMLDQKRQSPEYQEYLKRKGLVKEMQIKINAAQRQAEKLLKELEKKHRMTLYVAEGEVYEVAPCLFSAPPGRYKLKQGNYVLFYLRKSPECNVKLEDYLYKKVGIIGTIKPAEEGWGDIPVLVIDEIDAIEE